MFLTTHVITGATIGRNVENPALAIAVSFLSHFVLDKIPHWNPIYPREDDTRIRDLLWYSRIPRVGIPVFVDFCLAIAVAAIVLLFTQGKVERLRVGLAMAASVLPDIIDLARFFRPIKGIAKPYNRFHDAMQYEINHPVIGILTQGSVIAIAIIADFLFMG